MSENVPFTLTMRIPESGLTGECDLELRTQANKYTLAENVPDEIAKVLCASLKLLMACETILKFKPCGIARMGAAPTGEASGPIERGLLFLVSAETDQQAFLDVCAAFKSCARAVAEARPKP